MNLISHLDWPIVLRIPMLLIPLSPEVSRGDQVSNAVYFHKSGFCHILMESELTKDTFQQAVQKTYQLRENLIANRKASGLEGSCDRLYDLMNNISNK